MGLFGGQAGAGLVGVGTGPGLAGGGTTGVGAGAGLRGPDGGVAAGVGTAAAAPAAAGPSAPAVAAPSGGGGGGGGRGAVSSGGGGAPAGQVSCGGAPTPAQVAALAAPSVLGGVSYVGGVATPSAPGGGVSPIQQVAAVLTAPSGSTLAPPSGGATTLATPGGGKAEVVATPGIGGVVTVATPGGVAVPPVTPITSAQLDTANLLYTGQITAKEALNQGLLQSQIAAILAAPPPGFGVGQSQQPSGLGIYGVDIAALGNLTGTDKGIVVAALHAGFGTAEALQIVHMAPLAPIGQVDTGVARMSQWQQLAYNLNQAGLTKIPEGAMAFIDANLKAGVYAVPIPANLIPDAVADAFGMTIKTAGYDSQAMTQAIAALGGKGVEISPSGIADYNAAYGMVKGFKTTGDIAAALDSGKITQKELGLFYDPKTVATIMLGAGVGVTLKDYIDSKGYLNPAGAAAAGIPFATIVAAGYGLSKDNPNGISKSDYNNLAPPTCGGPAIMGTVTPTRPVAALAAPAAGAFTRVTGAFGGLGAPGLSAFSGLGAAGAGSFKGLGALAPGAFGPVPTPPILRNIGEVALKSISALTQLVTGAGLSREPAVSDVVTAPYTFAMPSEVLGAPKDIWHTMLPTFGPQVTGTLGTMSKADIANWNSQVADLRASQLVDLGNTYDQAVVDLQPGYQMTQSRDDFISSGMKDFEASMVAQAPSPIQVNISSRAPTVAEAVSLIPVVGPAITTTALYGELTPLQRAIGYGTAVAQAAMIGIPIAARLGAFTRVVGKVPTLEYGEVTETGFPTGGVVEVPVSPSLLVKEGPVTLAQVKGMTPMESVVVYGESGLPPAKIFTPSSYFEYIQGVQDALKGGRLVPSGALAPTRIPSPLIPGAKIPSGMEIWSRGGVEGMWNPYSFTTGGIIAAAPPVVGVGTAVMPSTATMTPDMLAKELASRGAFLPALAPVVGVSLIPGIKGLPGVIPSIVPTTPIVPLGVTPLTTPGVVPSVALVVSPLQQFATSFFTNPFVQPTPVTAPVIAPAEAFAPAPTPALIPTPTPVVVTTPTPITPTPTEITPPKTPFWLPNLPQIPGMGGGMGPGGAGGRMGGRGIWAVKGFGVYGPSPVTGKVVGGMFGAKEIPYGAVVPRAERQAGRVTLRPSIGFKRVYA